MPLSRHDIYWRMKVEGQGTSRLEEAKDASDELSEVISTSFRSCRVRSG